MTIEAIAELAGINIFLLIFLLIWSLFWKGLALWRAAELGQKYWFIVIFLINTFGILDIIYLFFVAKKYKIVEADNKTV